MDDHSAPPSFVALIKAFQAFLHIPEEDKVEPAGLAFTTQGMTVRVMPHNLNPQALLLEIDVCAANGPDAGNAAMLMHRLNYLSRFTHAWKVAIDEEDMVVLYASRTIAGTDPGRLEALMADGLDRAKTIQQLWQQQSIAATTPNIGMMLGGLKA